MGSVRCMNKDMSIHLRLAEEIYPVEYTTRQYWEQQPVLIIITLLLTVIDSTRRTSIAADKPDGIGLFLHVSISERLSTNADATWFKTTLPFPLSAFR